MDLASMTPFDLTGAVVRTLVLYALAEHQGGGATSIVATMSGTSFSVEDNGRGHGLARTIAGVPYLHYIYTHLEYPFGEADAGEVQLQGLGMSLVTALCSELHLTVRTPAETLRLRYADGRLCGETREQGPNTRTGNTIEGRLRAELSLQPGDEATLERWLVHLQRLHPTLGVVFNGRAVVAG